MQDIHNDFKLTLGTMMKWFILIGVLAFAGFAGLIILVASLVGAS